MDTEPRQEKAKVYSTEKNNELRAKFMRFQNDLATVDLDRYMELSEEISQFGDNLRHTYTNPNFEKYAMWHVLAGSTIDPTREAEIMKDDFPDNDSVEKFINDSIEKYKQTP